MPIHEKQYIRCRNVFELLHKVNEDCKPVCSKCMVPIYFIRIEVQ